MNQLERLKKEGVEFEVVDIAGLSDDEIDEKMLNNKIIREAIIDIAGY